MLFKKKSDTERRSLTKLMRWTTQEWGQVEQSARLRNLSPTEFIRRAALGKRTDVRYSTDIILEIRTVTKAIRDLHAAYLEIGVAPPEDVLRPFFDELTAAMQRVAKY